MRLSKPCVQSHLGQLATARPLGQIIYYNLIVHVGARASELHAGCVFFIQRVQTGGGKELTGREDVHRECELLKNFSVLYED